MTISSSSSFDLTADDMVKQALQAAGVLALGRRPRPDQLDDARDILTVLLKAMQDKGVMLVTAERVTLALVAGQASYTLATDTIDVEFPTTYSPPGSTSEQIVERMVYSDYAPLSDKTASGTPVRVYIEKSAILTATFWNVPSEAGTWHYRRVRLIKDATSGSTLDVTRRYLQSIVWKLAHRLAMASGVSLQRVQYLEGQATASQSEAEGNDNEGGDMQICLPDVYGRY